MSNKFFAKKFVDGDGIKWDSKKEYSRYLELRERLENDEITFLQRQVKFQILPKQKDERKVEYIADFVYLETKEKKLVIEDVKSNYTRKDMYYVLKRKLTKFVYVYEPNLVGLKQMFPNRDFDKAEFREVVL